MKRKRYHGMYEQYLFEQEQEKRYQLSQDDLMKKQSQERQDFFDKLNRYRTQRELALQKKVGLAESVYNDILGTAFKAIYITSLGDISEQAEAIANRNVDNYITENGGARKIIRENSGKTYLLDTIFEFVNEAYENEMHQFDLIEEAAKKAEKDEKQLDNELAQNQQNQNQEDQENNQEDQTDLNQNVDNSTKTKNSKSNKDKNGDGIEDADAQIQDIEQQTGDQTAEKEPTPEDNSTSKEPQAIEDADVNEKIAQQPDSKEELFKKMEQEDDVNAAVDLISQRIQDAEADFIKKNAQDKKKIEKIVDKLNTRINGATGNTDQNISTPPTADTAQADAQNQEIQSAQQEAARAISNVRENGRFHSIFEEMVKANSSYITKNNTLLESYTEDGKLDIDSIVESTKAMYGFLEFVNTIQLEDVDCRYIQEVLESY